jgi:hypothetical protein
MIGVPTSTAFSKQVMTPEENVFHHKPSMAKTTTTNMIKPQASKQRTHRMFPFFHAINNEVQIVNHNK